MLNSPLLLSDNFLNEAHYVLIDFSYSFSPVNTPKVLLIHSVLPPIFSPHISFSLPRSTVPAISFHLSIGFYQVLPEQWQTAEHLRELNGFQLAKQIPSLTLTLSHSASEILGGHYRQLEFNKPNMLTVLMEREEGSWWKKMVPLSLLPLSLIYISQWLKS